MNHEVDCAARRRVRAIAPIVSAVRRAKRSIRVTIFRGHLPELERGLGNAVTRGVRVHALIAHTNRAGEPLLRGLEQRLLGLGVTVSRTADDLIRYHDKLLIVDDTLYVMAFNFTRVQVTRRRSLAIETRSPRLVSEAASLFDADATRQPYTPGCEDLVVSPTNARARLAALLGRARRARSASTTPSCSTPRCSGSCASARRPASRCG